MASDNQTANPAPLTIANRPLRPADYWNVAVASMEQVIGAGLSTVIGIMLPMMQLAQHNDLPSWGQGLLGATGLIGIGVGSPIIGKLSDRQGYLWWFRICPILIMVGAALCLLPGLPLLVVGLLLCGIGVGGGYSLDSAYISELLPDRWKQVMVGVAKASSSIGFIAVAAICYFIIKADPDPMLWRKMMLIIGAMGLLTLLMRVRWAESPAWLAERGLMQQAQKAARVLLGKGIAVEAPQAQKAMPKVSWGSLFKGENLKRVIFSGIPWACEGLGVYGFGVFLPILVMAMGIESSTTTGMPKIIDSVETTAIVNFFILPGFVIGLLIMHKMNHVRMLYYGFIMAAIGLGLLFVGYELHWGKAPMILGFVIFEVFLNAGPHLITFIIPSKIFPVEDRGAGSGIAAMLGKVGAVLGVVLMPILLHAGGVKLVLIVSISVMLAGAFIGIVYGKQLKLV